MREQFDGWQKANQLVDGDLPKPRTKGAFSLRFKIGQFADRHEKDILGQIHRRSARPQVLSFSEQAHVG